MSFKIWYSYQWSQGLLLAHKTKGYMPFLCKNVFIWFRIPFAQKIRSGNCTLNSTLLIYICVSKHLRAQSASRHIFSSQSPRHKNWWTSWVFGTLTFRLRIWFRLACKANARPIAERVLSASALDASGDLFASSLRLRRLCWASCSVIAKVTATLVWTPEFRDHVSDLTTWASLKSISTLSCSLAWRIKHYRQNLIV